MGGGSGPETSRHPSFANIPTWTGGETIPLTPDRSVYERFGKRLLDLILSGGALLALSPLLLLIAASAKLEDGGPIFYRSTRVGRGGRPFCFWKFRSMIRDAESSRDRLQNLNEVDGPVFKIENDPRITRVDRILRRTSMDELPQFWNVFIGDMSLVGPRPPIAEEVVKYEPWQLRRLSVRPGLTCLWQISGRCRIGFDEWMRLDMEYIDRRSFALDVEILARTIPAVLSGEGAY
jgi:lipopolysaccharide/colanic/teichoic acid biosynthesis glycosyltransferase